MYDVVERDLAAHEARINRREAKELTLESLQAEEYQRLTETAEGIDETLAFLLDRPGNDLTKGGFLEQLTKMVSKTRLRDLSEEELQVRATLRICAETLAERNAHERLEEARKDLEATLAGW